MSTEMKNFSIRLPNNLYEAVRQEANFNKRSMGAQIEWLVEIGIKRIQQERRVNAMGYQTEAGDSYES
jgi:hypothetical protein